MADAVVLTGATGFVGRAVLAELAARGLRVHAVSRRPGPAQANVAWHAADLLTLEGRARVAGLAPCLVHCAWDVEHGAFWTSASNAHWHTASLDLAHRFVAAGGRRIIGLGSCAEYDVTAPLPWAEDSPVAPVSAYGQAKTALHRDLETLCPDGLIWARLFHLFGPGEDRRRLIPSLIDTLRDGRIAELRAARLVRDYASTGHVAKCLAALIAAQATGTFNIGSGAPRSLGDIAQVIAAAIGPGARVTLGHAPGPQDPAIMVPDLTRLWATTGLQAEDLDTALQAAARG